MENIWNKKVKPNDYPGQEQMDLGVGMMFRKFHEIEGLMVKIIVSSASIDQDSAQRQMTDWISSKKQFVKVVNSYKDLSLFDNARCGALDEIREDRNYFAHNYSGKKKEYGRLKNLIENIDSTLDFLKHVEEKSNADLKRRESKSRHNERNNLRSDIIMAAKQCKKDKMGYVRLSEVGNILKNQGKEIKGLRDKCIELGIMCRDVAGGANANANARVYYIKPN